MADIKNTINLARKQASMKSTDLIDEKNKQKRDIFASGNSPLGTSNLAGKDVYKTGFKEELEQNKANETARIEKKRQACLSKGGTFDPVSETCSLGITENLSEGVSLRTTEEERKAMQEEGKIKLERDLAEKGDISALIEMKSQEGFDTDQERKDFEALISGLEKKKEEERKTTFEEKLVKKQLEEKATAEQKAAEAEAPGITRGVSDIGFARGVQGLISKEAELLQTQAATKKVEIEETAQKIRDSLAEGRADLAAVYQKQYTNLRADEISLLKQKTQSILDAVGSNLSGMTDEELIQISDETGADLTTLELTRNRLKTENLTEKAKVELQEKQVADKKVTDFLNAGLLGGADTTQLEEFAKGTSFTAAQLAYLSKQQEEILNTKEDDPLLAEKKAKYNAEVAKIEAETLAKLKETEDVITTGFTKGNEVIIKKGENNPYLGKEGGSLTFRTNNPGAITAPAGNIEEANRLAKKHGAIPGLYSQDALGKLVLNFESEEAGLKAMSNLLNEYGDVSIGKAFETWSGTAAQGYKQIAKEKGFDIDQKFSELLPNEKTEIAKIINQVEAGPNAAGKDVEPTEIISGKVPELTQFDIANFNNSTFKPQKDLETAADKAKYDLYLEKRKNILSNPDPKINDILEISEGGKDLTDSAITKLDKFGTVLSGTSDLLATIQEANKSIFGTGPISGMIAELNPYNTPAQTLKRQLIALIPNLARGVYGEVGVLTDNDVKLYAQTLPNLTQTEDVNKAVLGITLRTIQRSYQNSLKTQAAAGRDVSGFIGAYQQIEDQVKEIENELGIGEAAKSVEAEDLANKYDPELSSITNKYNLQ